MAQDITDKIEVKGLTFAITSYALLLLFTPYQEAPKNIFSVVLILWGIFNFQAIKKYIHINPIASTSIIFLLSSVVAFFTSSYKEVLELKNVAGALKIGLILIPVMLLSLAHQNFWKISAIFIAIGGIISGIDGLVNWKGHYPQYNSVGHINHTALYVCIQLGASLTLVLATKIYQKLIGITSLIIALVFLANSSSLLAIILSLLILFTFIFVHFSKLKDKKTTLLITFILVTLASAYSLSSTPLGKQLLVELKQHISKDITSSRYGIALTAIEGAKLNPFFGAGPRMFRRATDEATIREILRSENRNYDSEKKDFIHYIHGHNTWVNNYVERGLFSLLFFTACAIFSVIYLFRYKPKRNSNIDYKNTYILFATAGIVLFIGGLMQTTYIVEHGLVSGILLTSGAQFLKSFNQS